MKRKVKDAKIEFEKENDGKVKSLILYQGGEIMPAHKSQSLITFSRPVVGGHCNATP